MIDKLTQKYSLSKTLRFRLIPQEETETFVTQEILQDDLELSIAYQETKKIIDRYHVTFIDEALNQCALSHLCEYAALYATASKTDKEIDAQNKLEIALRKTHVFMANLKICLPESKPSIPYMIWFETI